VYTITIPYTFMPRLQQLARNLMLVARNTQLVAGNKLRWCKRGISVNDMQRIGLRVINTILVCVAGGFANMRSDWLRFLVNCGTLVDRFLAHTYAKITFYDISAIFAGFRK